MPDNHIELRHSADISDGDRLRLAEMERDVDWGTPQGVTPLRFGDGVRWRVLVRDREQVVCTVQMLERQVLVGRDRLIVAGIAGVMTTKAYQGRGHASAAMRRAAAFLNDEREMAFALLVCWPSRVSFYERLGWREHPGKVVCEQPGGQVTIDPMRVMVLDGRQCPLPDAHIDLRGLPW